MNFAFTRCNLSKNYLRLSGNFMSTFTVVNRRRRFCLQMGLVPRRVTAEQTLTFVLLQQVVHVLYDLIILLQLQHALTVVQFQRDDHSTQINVVHVTRHLLHTHVDAHANTSTDQKDESVRRVCTASLVRILIFNAISC